MKLSRDGTVFALLTLSVTAEGIDRVMWMMSPTKLAVLDK